MRHGLIVDHSRVIRIVACRILAALSFGSEAAADGASALMACRRSIPDVVLLGRVLDMDEAEFLRALRLEAGADRPAVIVCPVEQDAARIAAALYAGASDCLVQPFDRSSIEAKFAEMGLV
ncbi:MAG: response regulator [Patescibacteria group bacterium]|nr:response regulator [Patescibacteria group bacterium]